MGAPDGPVDGPVRPDGPVRVTVGDGVATLTINRPDRRNALSEEVVTGLTAALRLASEDPEVRVVVLTGAGDRAFCAGGDLSPTPGGTLDRHWRRGTFVELIGAIRHAGKPVVARVNGAALGGGFGLALACHLVVAVEDVELGTPEVRLGLFPMMIMPILLRNLGRKKATEMILTGGKVTGAEAARLGFVNRAVPRAELDDAVAALCGALASKSPATLRLGLDAMDAAADMDLDQALPYLQAMLTINTMSEDAAEGVMAFLGKREPKWKGR